MKAPVYDVVVVGGGAAGLSAALVLGRARRRVAVVDAGAPRNASAAHMQGFLSRDGMAPADLLAAGRAEVTRYGVELVDDGDATSVELLALVGPELVGVGEEDDVVGPLAHELCVLDGAGHGAEYSDRLVADFPPVAIRAMQEITPPSLADAGDVGQLVAHTGCDQDPPRL